MHMNMHKPTGLHFPIDFSTRLRFALEFVIAAWHMQSLFFNRRPETSLIRFVRCARLAARPQGHMTWLRWWWCNFPPRFQSFKRDVFKSREIVICHRVKSSLYVLCFSYCHSEPSFGAQCLSLLAPNEKRTKSSSMGIWKSKASRC